MKEFSKITIMAVTPIIIAIFVFIVIMGICGWMIKGANKVEAYSEDRFIKVQDWRNNFVMYDRETKVQYYVFGSGGCGGITVLVDADGKPLLYEGE